MLGGGNFISMNKTLPGAYINFVSAAKATATLSDRGIVAVPLTLSWGPEKKVFEVTKGEFQTNTVKIFGYGYDAPEMQCLRELFQYATKAVCYRLNTGVKATNDYATALYSGKRGNDIKIVISNNVDHENAYDVKTFLELQEVDSQTVGTAADLHDNEYVSFKKDMNLSLTAGINLAGGTDGEDITGADHSGFLAAIEQSTYHVLCCPVTNEVTKSLYIAFTIRLREEAGVKFQTVVYQKDNADHEGVISVENRTAESEQGLVYWVSGVSAACAVNKTNENKVYNGELTIDTEMTQSQLEEGIKAGKFLFHKSGNDVRVLMDINTLTSFTADKSSDFSSNQTIRVLDQIGNDVATLFNSKYLGTVPNDDSGRTSLWNDVVTYCKQLSQLRAIEAVEAAEITVAAGETKRAVVINCPVTPINCMSQLYMTIIVS